MLLVEITVCASVGESPCAACVHCACASASPAGLGSCTSMAGCIEASFSQGERGFFFSPLLGQNQGDCAAPRLSPDASKRERLHITQRAGCSSDALAGRSQGPRTQRPETPSVASLRSRVTSKTAAVPLRVLGRREHVIRLIWHRQDSTSRDFQLCCPAEGCRHEPTGEDVHAKAMCTGR